MEISSALELKAPKRQPLTQQVVDQLIEKIMSGRLPAGTLLPKEEQLTEQLGVSRTVIRESLRVLSALGLVDIQHGVGTFVNTANSWRIERPLTLLLQSNRQSLMDWLEVRMHLEVSFAQLAAQRATAEHVATIRQSLEAMRTTQDDADGTVEADLSFHRRIAMATGNTVALALMRPILQPLQAHLRMAVHLPGMLAHAIAEHEAIYQAIAERSPDRAAEAMQAHLLRVTDEIRSLYNNQEVMVGVDPAG